VHNLHRTRSPVFCRRRLGPGQRATSASARRPKHSELPKSKYRIIHAGQIDGFDTAVRQAVGRRRRVEGTGYQMSKRVITLGFQTYV
jgi:hypothetical protein